MARKTIGGGPVRTYLGRKKSDLPPSPWECAPGVLCFSADLGFLDLADGNAFSQGVERSNPRRPIPFNMSVHCIGQRLVYLRQATGPIIVAEERLAAAVKDGSAFSWDSMPEQLRRAIEAKAGGR